MSNELITALEHRVTSAVDTIEGLRTEVRVLKEERQLLESKLRELLQKIEGVDNGATRAASSEATHDADANRTAGYGFGTMGMGRSTTEY
jgi:FtsZ-binding cell division protein ZapB